MLHTMKDAFRAWPHLLVAACVLVYLAGCASARVTQVAGTPAAAPAAPPPVIVVYDFELDSLDVRSQPGLIPRPHVLGRFVPGHSACNDDDPDGCAAELRELIAKSLVDDLRKKGLNAVRGGPAQPLPAAGWLVRGVFTDVDTGNQLRRAVLGMGSGATQVQLVLGIDDLARGVPQPIYQADANASSGKAPGGLITLNPAAMGARFVMARKDTDKSVKKLAAEVADSIATRAGVAPAK
jgi:Domain of unknown function (DUF4410)